jgi:hypothetical protein
MITPKVGVYTAAGPNPIFMRMLMLQLARQTRLPDYISIYENGNKTSGFHWVCKEIIEQLESKGVKVFHRFSPVFTNITDVHREAIKTLIEETDADVFLKMDSDDFYLDQYVENTQGMLSGHDWAINLNSGILLVRPAHKDFKIKRTAVMVHSPVGAAPTHVSFNRKFAERYLEFLEESKGNDESADDELMASVTKLFSCTKVDGPVDYVYISHGGNNSSAMWQSTGGRIYFD